METHSNKLYKSNTILIQFTMKSWKYIGQKCGKPVLKNDTTYFLPHILVLQHVILDTSYPLDLCTSLHGVPLVSWGQDAL